MKTSNSRPANALRGSLWLPFLLLSYQSTRADITIDGDLTDWDSLGAGSGAQVASVEDPADMLDANGDIRQITASVEGDNLKLTMKVEGAFGPTVDQTVDGNSNRHYYHWILDTDNDPATGFSNSEYEGNPTNLARPIGADIVIQIGWRDGAPEADGVYAYDPRTQEVLAQDYQWSASGDTATASIPLASLKLTPDQTIGFSAFQEGASDGWAVDWVESTDVTLTTTGSAGATIASVDDPADMLDANGDIRQITASVEGDNLKLTMKVEGAFGPTVDQTVDGNSNRHYYHWILDTDNDPATGFSNSEYEGNPTNLARPIGADIVIQIGWRDGAPEADGVYAYDPRTQEVLAQDYQWSASGDTATASIPLASLKLTPDQTIGFSAFQEGASDGWAVDWVESTDVTLTTTGSAGATIASVDDPADMLDANGDIRQITASVEGDNLKLTMKVEGAFGPTVDQTVDGNSNRHYYHWILDTDNDPATGFSNSEYEGNPTNLARPIGADIVIQIGWRDGAPEADGVYAYDPRTQEVLAQDYQWSASGDTATASIPLASLKLTPDQTIGFSAFQEGASDGWAVDWVESTDVTLTTTGSAGATIASVDDPADMLDANGDIRQITASVEGDNLKLTMKVEGAFGPTVDQTVDGNSNRHYYHWILDTDNDPATGFSNSEYEGNPTNLARPIGADIVIQIGWRDGAPEADGVYAYDPRTQEVLAQDYQWSASGDTATASIPLASLKLTPDQTIGFSAFQEGASDGWAVDWVESTDVTLTGGSKGASNIASVDDPDSDMADPNGDITAIQAAADGTYIYLAMTVKGAFGPTSEQTSADHSNRHYYHWLLDTDNDPATGFSNSEYEGTPTNLARPIGADIVIQIGWRDGAPEADGVYAYDPRTQEVLIQDYEWSAMGNTAEARIPLQALGLTVGQTVGFSAFQEGASNGWQVDWVESVAVTLAPPSVGNIDLTTKIVANAFGYEVQLQDQNGAVVDTNSIRLLVNGQLVESSAVKTDGVTELRGRNATWLAGDSDYRLRVEYQLEGQAGAHFREFPFTVPKYTLIPSFYAANDVDGDAQGFIANVTQISEAQADDNSAHSNQSDLAELQLRGQLKARSGKVYVNEANVGANAWQPAQALIDGIINWHEDTATETGHFKKSTGLPDQEIPMIPGSEGSTNGIVMEILTYLDLEPGFHRFGVNTTGGYKATMGPDGRDKLAPVLDVFNGSKNYSYEADHYFNVLAEESGFYPIRVLWFHTAPTKEGAQLEFYSIKNKKRIPINDPNDPDALRAYRAAPTSVPYISNASPAPRDTRVTADSVIELEISAEGTGVKPGSIELWLDGEKVVPQITGEGTAVIKVSYDPGVMQQGSEHQVEFAYLIEGDPEVERRERYTFGINSDAIVLPVAWAGPEAADAGFQVRTVQTVAGRGNSVAAAEAQLASAGDFSKSGESLLINFSTTESGLFGGDDDLSGWISPDNSEYFSMEVITYLHLSVGVHTFGVNSDDGFALTAGATPTDQSLALMAHEGGRGISDSAPQNLVDVLVYQEGDYAFRLVWYQGTGDAAVEWFSYDRATGEAILVNDADNVDAIIAMQNGHTEPLSKPGPEVAAPSAHRLRTLNLGEPVRESSVFVLNAGTANAVDIGGVTITGADAALFTLDGFPAAIAPQEFGRVDVSFRPDGRIGTYRATLEIDSNDARETTLVSLFASSVDPTGPIAHYRFDDPAGSTTASDATGYERHGRLIDGGGTAQLGGDGLADGGSLTVAAGGHARVEGKVFDSWDSFTMSAWIQADSASGTQTIFSKGNGEQGEPTFALLLAEGTLTWFVGSEPEFSSDVVISANTPYHVAVVYDNSSEARRAALLVDGVEVAAYDNPQALAISSAFPLFIGSFDSVLAFGGQIDDLQIYDRALAAADVAFLNSNPGSTVSAEPVDPGPTGEAPVVGTVSQTASGLQLQLSVPVGGSYDIEYSETLEPGSWQVIGSGLNAAAYEDADPNRVSKPSGFYRAVGK